MAAAAVIIALALVCCALAVIVWHQRKQRFEADARRELDEAKRRQELDELERDYLHLIEALNNLSAGVLLSDADGKIIFRNHASHAFTQTRHGDTLVSAIIDDHLATARAGKTSQREIQLYGPPDQTLMLHTFAVSDACAAAVIEDISHQVRHEIVRRDLVANISHELRTPVGAMGVLSDAMQGETDPQTLLDLSASINKESQRLTQIVADLLELSQLEQSPQTPSTEVVLQDVISRAITRVSGVADQEGVTLEPELADAPIGILGDSFQLTSAVFNLLENAVKYSQPGTTTKIRLFCEVGEGADSDGADGNRNGADGLITQAKIIVQDQGIGISRNEQSRIFERFYRVDKSRSLAVGHGLGLALVHQVVALHGGTVTLESEEGVGSAFTLSFPTSGDRNAASNSNPSVSSSNLVVAAS